MAAEGAGSGIVFLTLALAAFHMAIESLLMKLQIQDTFVWASLIVVMLLAALASVVVWWHMPPNMPPKKKRKNDGSGDL